MSRPLTRVCVVGRDASAWLTALGLQRAFGRIGLEITVVDLASLVSPTDAYVALPTLGGLHRLLGIDEEQVVAACGGVYSLGQRFANWSGGRAPFVHAYDTQPTGVNNVELVQYWVKARSEGLNVAFEEFSLGAAMAKHGRLVLDVNLSEGFSKPAHGYHLSARAYVEFLRARAVRGGVTRLAAGVSEVRIEGERIAAVTLTDGTVVEADLFIDASGAEALLIGRLPGAAFQSWRPWLPCDRVLTAVARPLDPLPAFAQISAFRAGWIGLYPLRDRTAITAVYDSNQTPDREVLEALPVLSGLALEGEALVASLEPGMRERAWVGNCVAMGDTAISLEPLDAVPLHLIQASLSLLIALFPADADDLSEAGAYNASLEKHAANARDFQIAHYKLNQRRDDAFWNRARSAEVPETLAYKLRLFGARGRVALYDDETFQEPNWTAILIGHGLIPRDYDPLVDMLEPQDQILQLQRMLKFIADEVTAMPTLQSQLGRAPGSGPGAAF